MISYRQTDNFDEKPPSSVFPRKGKSGPLPSRFSPGRW